MFKKFLAKLGKGAATVDLRFENRPYQAGETVQGEVLIKGGEVEQTINHLAARFMMSVSSKQGERITREVDTIPLAGSIYILSKEEKVFPFTYQLPMDLPISRGSISYHFDTHLDIQGGVDRTDIDGLILEASKEMLVVFNALGRLGLREKATSGKLDRYGQEFAFFPTQAFSDEVNEVEFRFAYEEQGLRVYMEVDLRSGYRQEIEVKREFLLEQDILQEEERLTELLHDYIAEMLRDPYQYTHPFSYYHDDHHSHRGGGMGSMIGGLAAGVLGGMLISELMDSVDMDGMMEGAAEAIGMDEDSLEDLGDFFGDDEDEEV